MRNQELRRDGLILGAMTIFLTILSFYMSTIGCILVFAACFGFSCFHFLTEYRRYRRIGQLSADLDRLLHDGTPLAIGAYSEEELSILAIQLQKMTLRLVESAEQSKADKAQLAESLANISHQLRTPLTAMNLTAAMLAQPELSPQRRQELTMELRNLLSRTDWLVESLLKLSKLDAGTVAMSREMVPLRELIDRSAAPLAVPMDLRDQKLAVRCDDSALTIDPVWTAEALGNILKNCMEHTPSGGTITVTAEKTALFTCITVEDTGPGFQESDIPHLFERFYKGSNGSQNSYGIGLALARTVVAAQNGTIQAMNGSTGAKFVLKFYHQII